MTVSPIIASDIEDPVALLLSATAFFSSSVKELPAANLYGIAVGALVFFATVITVIYILVAGGSFSRIASQQKEQQSAASQPRATAAKQLLSRPVLLDDLRTARTNMLRPTAPDLTGKMTLSAPHQALYKAAYTYHFAHKNSATANIPGDATSVITAYSRAAAAYAALFPDETTEGMSDAARRYARVYAAVATQSVKKDDKFNGMFEDPVTAGCMIGSLIHLLPYTPSTPSSYLTSFVASTDGSPFEGECAYDPASMWCFSRTPGPLSSTSLPLSPLFAPSPTSSSLLIVSNVTTATIGVVKLSHDSPADLSVTLEEVIVQPTFQDTLHEVEAVYLTLDRLFALGYRRVEARVDGGDVANKSFFEKIGFHWDGTAAKATLYELEGGDVVSSNAEIYSVLNSDWKGKVWERTFSAIYGGSAAAGEKKEREKDIEEDEKAACLAAQKIELMKEEEEKKLK